MHAKIETNRIIFKGGSLFLSIMLVNRPLPPRGLSDYWILSFRVCQSHKGVQMLVWTHKNQHFTGLKTTPKVTEVALLL